MRGFSTVETPLTRLNLLYVLFELFDECEVGFWKLNEFFVTDPIQTLLVKCESFTVYSDASCVGLGYVWMQYVSKYHE